jgi:YfiH family protein
MSAATFDACDLVVRGGVEVLEWKLFDGHALDCVITTRNGGVSTGPYASLNLGLHVGDDADAVIENRRRAAATIGLGLDDLVFGNQRHRRDVSVVGEGHRGRGARRLDDAIDGVDALVTAAPGVGLVVMVADCVPVVLYDPVAHVLACVHAGWAGTVRLVAEAAVATMTRLGSRPGDILAVIGPAVEVDRYQVGDDVAGLARDAFGAAADAVVRPDGTGRWLFDLWAANRHTLLAAGLRPEHVATSPLGSGDDRFFSDRLARPCGRFAGVARLHPRREG